MKMNGKRKVALLILFVATMISSLGSQAQNYVTVWTGDNRLGLAAGVGHHFTPFDLSVPTGYTLEKEATTALVTPSIGIYYGMEKELGGRWSFGYDTYGFLLKPRTYASLVNGAGVVYDYTFSALAINAYEKIYLAFRIAKDLQLNAGGGLAVNFMFNGEAVSETAGGPACGYDETDGMGMGLSLVFSAGITYYLSDIFFVKGACDVTTGSLFDSENWGSGGSSALVATATSGMNVALIATIGFKWK